MTDGMIADAAGNVYLSDIENSAIVRMTPEGKLQTLVKTEKLRWPDGFSLGPDKHLYVTCSSLHQVIGLDPESVRSTAPYQIYRVELPPTDD
jgi:sugar lactone lactonase YvrE